LQVVIVFFLWLTAPLLANVSKPEATKEKKIVDIEETEPASLEAYLNSLEFDFSSDNADVDSHPGEVQKNQITNFIRRESKIRSALVIGFDAGHVSEIFLKNCRKLKYLVALDRHTYPYTFEAANFLSSKYKEKFFFMEESSLQETSTINAFFPGIKFDLIYLDEKFDENFSQTLSNARKLAHFNTVLIVNRYDDSNIVRAIDKAQKDKILWAKKYHVAKEPFGSRTWLEACFRIK
jgi:hypothetical protein